MKNYLTLLFIILSLGAFAQEKEEIKKNTGIFNLTEIGYLPGVGNISYDNIDIENEANTYRLRTIFGYFLTPHFSLGAGIGLDGYHNPTYNTMPLFIEGRAYLLNNRHSPFFYADIGKAIKAGMEFEEGLFFNTGIGYKFFLSEKFCIHTSIGYNLQHMKEAITWYTKTEENGTIQLEEQSTDINMSSISFDIAIHFNILSLD